MAFNGSGVFNRLYNWVDDRVNGINIRADKMDDEQGGIATGLTNCVTRDGQTTILANLKMSGFKHTAVAPASAANQYLDVAAAQNGKINFAVTVAGSAASTNLTMFPTVSALVTGMEFWWISNGANVGSATLAVDGLSAIAIITGTSASLVGGEIASAAMTGARFQGSGKMSLLTMGTHRTFDRLTVASALEVEGKVSIGGALQVTGSAGFASTVSVGGVLTVAGDTNLAAAVSVGGALTVTGAVSCAGAVTITGAVSIDSTLKVNGTLTMGGAFVAPSTVDIAGATSVGGKLTVTGETSINGTFVVNGAVLFQNTAVSMTGLPTSDPLVSGRLWVNSGTLTVSA